MLAYTFFLVILARKEVVVLNVFLLLPTKIDGFVACAVMNESQNAPCFLLPVENLSEMHVSHCQHIFFFFFIVNHAICLRIFFREKMCHKQCSTRKKPAFRSAVSLMSFGMHRFSTTTAKKSFSCVYVSPLKYSRFVFPEQLIACIVCALSLS